MEKFFATFGKIILIIFILGSVLGMGMYLGKGNFFQPTKQLLPTLTPSDVTNTDLTFVNKMSTISPSPSVSPSKKPKKIVTAGLPSSSGLSFSQYQLELPDGWNDKDDKDLSVPTDTLTLTKGLYEIKIYQAATGGALCLYPGDPPFEGPSAEYTTFVDIKTADGKTFRRSGSGISGGKMAFTICQKSPSGDYQQPTPFGHMNFTLPASYDPVLLQEMDDILSSMKAI